MTEYSLLDILYQHLRDVGLPTDVSIELRGYSSNYEGKYDTVKQLIILYHLDEEGSLRDLVELLPILRHECIHHYQWKYDKNFTRVKGIMHNQEFLRLEKFYNFKAERLNINYYEKEYFNLCKKGN